MPRPTTNSPLLAACRKHLRCYYWRFVVAYGLEEEDLIQGAAAKLLEGSCTTINSACHGVVRAGVRYRKREILE